MLDIVALISLFGALGLDWWRRSVAARLLAVCLAIAALLLAEPSITTARRHAIATPSELRQSTPTVDSRSAYVLGVEAMSNEMAQEQHLSTPWRLLAIIGLVWCAFVPVRATRPAASPTRPPPTDQPQ